MSVPYKGPLFHTPYVRSKIEQRITASEGSWPLTQSPFHRSISQRVQEFEFKFAAIIDEAGVLSSTRRIRESSRSLLHFRQFQIQSWQRFYQLLNRRAVCTIYLRIWTRKHPFRIGAVNVNCHQFLLRKHAFETRFDIINYCHHSYSFWYHRRGNKTVWTHQISERWTDLTSRTNHFLPAYEILPYSFDSNRIMRKAWKL